MQLELWYTFVRRPWITEKSLEAHFLLKNFLGNSNFKTIPLLKSCPKFDKGANLGKALKGAPIIGEHG